MVGEETTAAPAAGPSVAKLSELIANPFVVKSLAVFLLLLVVSFTYMDIENGFIKNIAGQQPRRSNIAVSKYLTIMLANLVLMITALVGNIISKFIVGTVEVDAGGILKAGYTFGVKWLLLLALSALIMFLTIGLHAKPLATVGAVIAGTGFLSLFYMGLDLAISNVLHIDSLDLVSYAPDQLLTLDSYSGPKPVIVAVVFSVIFVVLTIIMSNKKDVK